MRILFVLHTYPPDAWGGTELHVQAVARHMASQHQVAVFCRGGDPLGKQDDVLKSRDEFRPAGANPKKSDRCQFIEVTRFNNLFRDHESFEWTYKYEAAHRAFEAELERFQPDLVHVHHLTGLTTTILETIKQRAIPLVFSLHDFWMVCPRGQRLHPKEGICETIDRSLCHECLGRIWPHWFPKGVRSRKEKSRSGNDLADYDRHAKKMLALPDLLLTPSAFHREKMLEGTGIDPERIIALAHGLDHLPFEAQPDHDPKPRPKVIGYIGTVINTKGVHVLLEAFNRLDDPNLELRIHGDTPAFHENAEYLSLMRDRVRSRGPIRFLGHYDNHEVAPLLAEVDILVVPSLWWETFSLTIRESILAGVPVVVSDIGAMKEAIDDSGAGLLFKTGDPEDLARTLKGLIEDDDLRARCSGHRAKVKTIQQNSRDYLALYEDAKRISKNRKGQLNVTSSSFPKKSRSTESKGRSRRPSSSRDRDATISHDPENDLSFSIEKIGDGEVHVQSAVERGDSTRVSFVFDYDSSAEASEVRLTIDFKKTGPKVIPAADDLPPVGEARRGATLSADAMAKSQDPDWDAEMRERTMYMREGNLGSRDSGRLKDLVEESTLEERDLQDPEECPRGRSRSSSSDRAHDHDRDRPRERSRKSRDDRPSRSHDRDQSRDDDREDAPRGRSRGPSRERGPSSEEREERPRRPRSADDRPASVGRSQKSERPESTGRSQRTERPKSDDRGQKSDRPRRSRSDEKPAPRARKAPKGAEDLVWGKTEDGDWKLPETSVNLPKKEDLRAPNYRVGKQPGHGGARGGGFGEGV
ncbi:MAG: glycosyltransferase [Planctomycetota bacterium]